MADVDILYLPSPPKLNVFRHWAGGYGTALPSKRDYPGHDRGYFEVPYLQLLYIARGVQNRNLTLTYRNLQQQERFRLPDLLAMLRQESPKVILTTLSLPSIDHDLEILQRIKAHVSVKIVLIGAVAKLFKERILQAGVADYILMQDEELLAPAVIEAIMQGEHAPQGAFYWEQDAAAGKPADQTMTDLNVVDFPAYELLDFTCYESSYPFNQRMRYMTVLTSKGCPYPCSYCPYPIGFGKQVLYRSPERVLADIRRLVEEFHVEFLVFRDQLLTLNRKHCEAILHGMIEANLNLIWLCETRFDLVDRELLELMHRAGCREINYGLESGDESIFLSVGKANIKRGLADCGQIIQATKAAGIRCHTHLMLGLPDDNRKSIKATVRFLKKYQPDSVQAAIFIPYPGTPLGDQLQQAGLVTTTNYQDYTGFKPVIPTKYMSVAEIEAARAYIGTVWNRPILTRIREKIQGWIHPGYTRTQLTWTQETRYE